MSGVTFFREQDADPAALRGTCLAVIGYGNLGRSMALNLRDGGLDLVVGDIDDDYRRQAVADGFEALDIADAVAAAGLAYVLLPDEAMPERFAADMLPHLRPGTALAFASGYVLAYGLVTVPDFVDVLLLAPRAPGEEVRRSYLDGTGFFGYVSVEQDASGEATARLLALAHAAGCLRKGALPLSARNEALLALLIGQTVGPYLGAAIQTAFLLGVGAGLPAEALVLEMYMSGEMSRTLQGFAEVGFLESMGRQGAVAQYGGFLRTLEMDREGMQRRFAAVLEDIRSGRFARRFQEEHAAGHPSVAAVNAMKAAGSLMTEAEQRVRAALGG